MTLRIPAATPANAGHRDRRAHVHAETFSGSLRTDYGKVVKAEFGPGSSLDVDSGDSGTRIDAQSFSGNVELHKQ